MGVRTYLFDIVVVVVVVVVDLEVDREWYDCSVEVVAIGVEVWMGSSEMDGVERSG